MKIELLKPYVLYYYTVPPVAYFRRIIKDTKPTTHAYTGYVFLVEYVDTIKFEDIRWTPDQRQHVVKASDYYYKFNIMDHLPHINVNSDVDVSSFFGFSLPKLFVEKFVCESIPDDEIVNSVLDL